MAKYYGLACVIYSVHWLFCVCASACASDHVHYNAKTENTCGGEKLFNLEKKSLSITIINKNDLILAFCVLNARNTIDGKSYQDSLVEWSGGLLSSICRQLSGILEKWFKYPVPKKISVPSILVPRK